MLYAFMNKTTTTMKSCDRHPKSSVCAQLNKGKHIKSK